MPFVQTTKATGGVSPQTTSAFGSATTTGNLIVVSISVYNGSGALNSVTAVTDSAGNTYTRQASKARINGLIEIEVWAASNITGASGMTVQVTAGVLDINVIAQEFSGAKTSSPLDQTASGNGNSSSLASGTTATLSGPSEIVIGAFASDVSLTFTVGSGYSNLDQKSSILTSVMMESLVASSTAGQQATATMSGSSDYAGVVVTFLSSSSNLTSTKTSVSRISASVTSTKTSVSRIQKSLTSTQTSVSRISKGLNSTKTSVSRISNTGLTSSLTSVSRISKGLTSTKTSVSRIQKSLTSTQSSVSRISSTLSATRTSVSRVQKLLSSALTSVSRIYAAVVVTYKEPILVKGIGFMSLITKGYVNNVIVPPQTIAYDPVLSTGNISVVLSSGKLAVSQLDPGTLDIVLQSGTH